MNPLDLSMGRKSRRQHGDIRQIVESLQELINKGNISGDATELRALLSKFVGKINVHLVAEDNVLYPAMLKSSEQMIADVTQKYKDEMATLHDKLTQYSKKWFSATTIKDNRREFVSETEKIFQQLKYRIEREDKELYPLADKIG